MYLTFRNKPVKEIFELLGTVRPGWILISLLLLIIVFFLRAARWRLLLMNSDEKPSFRDVSYSLLLGFFINSFTPKLGEVIRCTSLQKSSGVPATKSFGTVISERIYDLLALVAGIMLILFFESGRIGPLINELFGSLFGSIHLSTYMTIAIVFAVVVVIAGLTAIVRRMGLSEKVRTGIKGIISGVKRTFRIKRPLIFLAETLAIWGVMVLMNFACLMALPSVENTSLYFAMVALFIGTLGWAIPSPGGMGTSHFFILQLFILFGLDKSTGVAYGILVNGVTVLLTIAMGTITIIIINILRLINKSGHNTGLTERK